MVLSQAELTNGATPPELRLEPAEPPPPDPRPRSVLQRVPIVREVPLGTGYPQWRVTLWCNPPKEVIEATQAHARPSEAERAQMGDAERAAEEAAHERHEAARVAALGQVFRAHNGWPDAEGYVLPEPTTRAFWDYVGADPHLSATLMAVLGKAVTSPLDGGLTQPASTASG